MARDSLKGGLGIGEETNREGIVGPNGPKLSDFPQPKKTLIGPDEEVLVNFFERFQAKPSS